MPNTGRPSPACHLCRTRRVKCDLTRPGCLRCSKVGRACPGYREEQDLLFHNENKTSIATKSRRSREPPNREITENSKLSGPRTSRVSPSPASCQLREEIYAAFLCHQCVPSHIVEDWNAYSIPIALIQFSATSHRPDVFGYFDCLPELYQEANSDPNTCLSLATSSVVRAFLTNLSDSSSNRSEHVQTYGRALRATYAALADPCERVKDSTIVAVWLLSVFELLTRSPDKPQMSIPAPATWHMHSVGILSLLRARGPFQFTTQRGRNLFWPMYLFIQVHCLTMTVECPPESLGWFEFLKKDMSETDQLAFTYLNYNYKIAAICAKIQSCYRNNLTATEIGQVQFDGILSEADEVQKDAHIWTTLTPLQLKSHFSPYIVNIFRAALIKLQQFLLMLIDHAPYPQGLPINIRSRRRSCIETIHRASQQILDSVPSMLGDTPKHQSIEPPCWAGGLRLLWPLIVVS